MSGLCLKGKCWIDLLQVKRLVEMGFGDAQVRSAIESSGGDENLALEKLCSG